MKKLLLSLPALCSPLVALAQTFSGPGYPGGTGAAAAVSTGAGGSIDIRVTLLNLLFTVLSYMGLLAVVVLVIVCIMLVISLGNEEAVARVKKVFIYVAVGFIIIILSDSLVLLFIRIGGGFFGGF